MYPAIVLMPLAGALIAGFFGRILGDRASGILTSVLVLAGAVLSWFAFFKVGIQGEDTATVILMPWISVGDALNTSWSLRIDTLTVVMLVVVNTVSAVVHFYSIGYMHDDDRQPLFFAELSLFTFAMLSLVTANNFIQLFFGWEGVGLASYLLIGFWYKRPSANSAAIKAFVVNRSAISASRSAFSPSTTCSTTSTSTPFSRPRATPIRPRSWSSATRPTRSP